MSLSESVIILTKKEELLSLGYIYTNVNKEYIYNDMSFLLKQHGIRSYIPLSFIGYNNKPKIVPRKPIWIVKTNGLTMEVTNII
tara:strand:+ start:241 stop:492 length:252 start_codon:yes stop_codon:yes gene_type:complete